MSDAGGKVILVRHGHTSMNKGGETSVDRIRAWTDVPLNASGLKDAEKVAAQLKDEKIHRIITSDLTRSRQTGAAIARVSKAPLTSTRALRPWGLGVLTGKPSTEATPHIHHYAEDVPDTKVPGGESFNDFKQRVIPALEKILTRAKSAGEAVVVVSHYRDLKLIEGWLKAGGKGTEIDLPTFFRNDILPGAILCLETNGSGWTYKVLSKGLE